MVALTQDLHNSPNRSLIPLCLRIIIRQGLQQSACSKLKSFIPQPTHLFGILTGCMWYLRVRASLNSLGDRSKWSLFKGIVNSQLDEESLVIGDTPFDCSFFFMQKIILRFPQFLNVIIHWIYLCLSLMKLDWMIINRKSVKLLIFDSWMKKVKTNLIFPKMCTPYSKSYDCYFISSIQIMGFKLLINCLENLWL